jgi:hypothetical protein
VIGRAAVLGVLVSLLSVPFARAQERPPAGGSATAPPSAPSYRLFVGGGLGLAFGSDVDYIEVAPLIGYRLSDRAQIGGTLLYRYRKDRRYEPDLSANDYGASVFGRYIVIEPLYLQLEVEQIRWEYFAYDPVGDDYGTVKSDYTGLYGGVGFALPAGPRAATYLSILYDFAFDSSKPSPHSDPWVFRIGVGVGL